MDRVVTRFGSRLRCLEQCNDDLRSRRAISLRAVGSLYFVTADFNPLDANDSSTWSAVGTTHVKRSINPILVKRW